MFHSNVTSLVPSQRQEPQESCDDLKTIADSCPAGHVFSNTFPSYSTRRAFLSSVRFFTVHFPRHAGSFATWFRRMVISDGERFAMPGSAPPNMMFSPAPPRKLFSMR